MIRANLLLMLCPGRVAMTRPLIGLPIKAMSPITSSSLWRAGSLSNTSGSLLIYPSSWMFWWGTFIMSANLSNASCDTFWS